MTLASREASITGKEIRLLTFLLISKMTGAAGSILLAAQRRIATATGRGLIPSIDLRGR